MLDAGLEVDLAEGREAGPLVEAAGVQLGVQLDRGKSSFGGPPHQQVEQGAAGDVELRPLAPGVTGVVR